MSRVSNLLGPIGNPRNNVLDDLVHSLNQFFLIMLVPDQESALDSVFK